MNKTTYAYLVQSVCANPSDGGSRMGRTVGIRMAERASMNAGLDVVLVDVSRVVADDDEVAAH